MIYLLVMYRNDCYVCDQIKNKPFIRSIALLHLSDCDVLSDWEGLELSKGCSIRVSNIKDEAVSLPARLLSVAQDELNDRDEAHKDCNTAKPSIDGYLLSEQTMQLWNFPLSDIDSNMNEQRSHKRARVDYDEKANESKSLNGVLNGQCPSIEETELIFHQCSDILRVKSVSSRDRTGTETGYYETVPFLSSSSLHVNTAPDAPLHALAIDCEMCLTSQGSELTRVTIVDTFNRIVFDSFVKPLSAISDYLTEYSGVTESQLRDVTVTLKQVQLAVLRIVSAETILIGHSLENDLRALRLVHRRCIDTSILFPHSKGFPYRLKLKHLAEEHLKLKIQRSSGGHDSAEDARAAMQLVLLKVERGPEYGTHAPTSRCSILSLDSVDTHRIESGFFWSDDEEAKTMVDCTSTGKTAVNNDLAALTGGFYEFLRKTDDNADNPPAMRLGYLGLNYEQMNPSLSSVMTQLRDMSSESRLNALLIITTQPSRKAYDSMCKRKKACQSPHVMAAWTAELEIQLSDQLSLYNTGRVYFRMFNS